MAERLQAWQTAIMPAKPNSTRAPAADRRWMFFALFLLVGLAALIPFALQAHRDWRIMNVYQEGKAEVLSFRLVPSTTTFRWGDGSRTEQTSQLPEFTFKFRVGSLPYVATGFDNLEGKAATFEDYRDFHTGGVYPCWYDPAEPERAVLHRKVYWPFYLGVLIPGVFIFMGGYLMMRSLRRRPDSGHPRVTEGKHLRYRLHPVLSHQRLAGALTVIELLLAMALALIWKAPWTTTRVTDLFSPMFYLFVIVAMIFLFIGRHLLRAVKVARVPEPEVEIQDEPLAAGNSTNLRIIQTGPIRAKSFKVELLCEEVASTTRTPVRETLLDAGFLELSAEPPASERVFLSQVVLPAKAKAKPSSRTLQSLRTWCIRVTRELDKGVTLESNFPFRVQNRKASSEPSDAIPS